MSRRDLAVDLGTANTLVFQQGRGVVFNEPTLVGVDVPRRQQQVTGRQLHPPTVGQLPVIARRVRRAVWLG